jgi:hypothetical protein
MQKVQKKRRKRMEGRNKEERYEKGLEERIKFISVCIKCLKRNRKR